MKSLALVFSLSFIFPCVISGQSMLELLTEELASFDLIQDDTMYSGEGGTGEEFTPEVAEVYFNFLEAATIEDLKALVLHDSPIVTCYAYRGLMEKGWTDLIPILDSNKENRRTVNWISDDIIESQTCYQWMLDRTKIHLDYQGLKLDPQQKADLQKRIDEEKKRVRLDAEKN